MRNPQNSGKKKNPEALIFLASRAVGLVGLEPMTPTMSTEPQQNMINTPGDSKHSNATLSS